MKKHLVIIFLLTAGISVFAQTEEEKGLAAINHETVKGQLDFLASDWTEGRAVGTKGAYLAADYIASMFQVYGIQPFGDEETGRLSRREMMAGMRPKSGRTYFQNFSLIKYEAGEDQSFSVISKGTNSEKSVDFGFKTDFDVRTGSVAQSALASVVFAGYGFTDKENGYDDLKKMNLKGKIVVVLSGFPGHKDTASVAYKKFAPEGRYAQYYLERNKMEGLEKTGAVAIIMMNPGSDPMLSWAQNRIYPVKGRHYEADEPLGSYYNTSMSMPSDTLTSNIPTFSVTPRLANEILAGTGIDLVEFEKTVAKEMDPASKELPGK